MTRPLLSVVVSHPIQYHAPLYRRLAKSDVLDLHVHFLSSHGVKESFDAGFGQAVRFDVPLTEGFSHSWHANLGPSRQPSKFLGQVHPQILSGRVVQGDVILMHGYAQASMWFVAADARRRKIPYMLRGESRIDTETRLGPAQLRLKHATVGRLVRNAAVCLPIGGPNRDFYRAYRVPLDRLVDAPYSVDNEYFSARRDLVQGERSDRLADFGLDPALRTVIYAGKMVPWKRPADVLEAAGRLQGSVNLLMVGSGELLPKLKARYAGVSNVAFPGFLNQSELRDAYCLSDVSVLPSDFEPWGLTVNESMAAGCVPLASRAVGCAEDLVAPVSDGVFAVGDIAGLAVGLKRALRIAGQADTATEVRKRVDQFDIESTAQGIERGVERALSL